MEAKSLDPFRDNIFKMREKGIGVKPWYELTAPADLLSSGQFKHQTHINSLIVRGWLVDVTIACNGQLFYAHKLILSASSDYFQEMFASVSNQQHPIIFLKDVSLELLNYSLEFMYCGIVDVPEEMVQSFIKIAKEFKIKGLNVNNLLNNALKKTSVVQPHLDDSKPIRIPRTTIVEADDDDDSTIMPRAKRHRTIQTKMESISDCEESVVESVVADEVDTKPVFQSWELFAVNFITHIGKFNTLTINQVRTIASAAASMSGEKSLDAFQSDTKWWDELKQKFPYICNYVKTDDLTESLNSSPSTKNLLDPLVQMVDKFKLANHPEYIWSCEEIAIATRKGSRKETIAYPARIKDNSGSNLSKSSESMSILCSISPSGKSTPPYFVVGNDHAFGQELKKGNVLYATNCKSSVDNEILLKWFTDVFVPQCPKGRSTRKPVILLIDSQFFNVTVELMERAFSENVVLFPIVPHIPVACQPFDLVLFNNIRPDLEAELYREKKRLRHSTNSYVPNKKPINLVKSILDKNLSTNSVKDGFSKCGIYPSNLASFVKVFQSRVGSNQLNLVNS